MFHCIIIEPFILCVSNWVFHSYCTCLCCDVFALVLPSFICIVILLFVTWVKVLSQMFKSLDPVRCHLRKKIMKKNCVLKRFLFILPPRLFTGPPFGLSTPWFLTLNYQMFKISNFHP